MTFGVPGIAVINVPIGDTQPTSGWQHEKASECPDRDHVGRAGRTGSCGDKSFSAAPRLERYGDAAKIRGFLHEYRAVLNPDAIYRAKLWGRIEPKQESSQSFLDLNYLPLVEAKVSVKRSRTGLRILSAICWQDLDGSYKESMSPRQATWLIQAPFWLLAAKILRDKQVPGFKNIDLCDFDGTFGKLAKHYQSKDSQPSPVTVAKYQERTLSEVATYWPLSLA